MNRRIGSRYAVDEQIGRGGMGEVFHGHDDAGAEYAVKILRSELAGDRQIVTRFVQERSILLGVSHPNLVRMHDLVVEGPTLAIVMDLVRGPDLRTAIKSVGGTCPPREVARLCAEISHALAAVHAVSVVHRDVKPENVLLDLSTRPAAVRLTDFGISRLVVGSELARTTVLMGTPLYMAPELIADHEASPASDLYSLGILGYELACGVTPFANTSIPAILHGHTAFAPGRPSGIPDQLWDLLTWLLTKDPAGRPKSTAEVGAAFDRLSRELPDVKAVPAIAVPPPGRPMAGPPMPIRSEATIAQPRQQPSPQPDLVSHGASVPPPTEGPRRSTALAAWAGFATALVLCLGIVAWILTDPGSGEVVAEAPSASPIPSADPSPSPSPTPSPTPTPVSASPNPTATIFIVRTSEPTLQGGPAGSEAGDSELVNPSNPADFLVGYYHLLPEHTGEAFAFLTARKQEEGQGFAEYQKFWSSIAKVETVGTPTVLTSSSTLATVQATIRYTKAQTGEVTATTYRFTLLVDGDNYLIDDNDVVVTD